MVLRAAEEDADLPSTAVHKGKVSLKGEVVVRDRGHGGMSLSAFCALPEAEEAKLTEAAAKHDELMKSLQEQYKASEAGLKQLKEEHKELHDRWDGAMHKLLLRARTALQVESAMCEQGSRQKAAKAGKGNKGRWEPGPCKDLSSVVVLHGAAGKLVGRETDVDLRSGAVEQAGGGEGGGGSGGRRGGRRGGGGR